MRPGLPLLVLAGCSFHATDVTSDAGHPDATIDAQPDASIDAPPPPPMTRSAQLTVDLGNITELDRFPLLVALDPARIDYSYVSDPTTGFTFVDGSGAILSYEVDHWDPTGSSALWVNVPVIAAGAPTVLTMTYGADQQPAAPLATWNGFTQVLHFDSSSVADSTGTFYAPTATGVTAGSGAPIGDGGGFGSASQVAFQNGQSLYSKWGSFTLQFWLYIDSIDSTGGSYCVMERGGPLQDGHFDSDDNEFSMMWTFQSGTSTPISATTNTLVQLQTWTLLGITWDGATLTAWRDGVAVQATPVYPGGGGTTISGLSSTFVLGCGFDGAIDELEVARTARTSVWMAAELASQSGDAISFTPL